MTPAAQSALTGVRSPELSSAIQACAPGVEAPEARGLRQDLAGRLARVCADLEPDSFAALVQIIVERKLLWMRLDVEEMLAARTPRAE